MTAARLVATPLSTVARGATARIVRVADEDVLALTEIGLREGTSVTVERHLPLGGPVLLEAGPARIAVARVVAARTLVVPGS